MKITSGLLIAINVIVMSMPTVVFAHVGHGTSSISGVLHQVLFHVTSNYGLLMLFAIVLVGLGFRALVNK